MGIPDLINTLSTLEYADEVRATIDGNEVKAIVDWTEAIVDNNQPKHEWLVNAHLIVGPETVDRLGLPRDDCIHVFVSRGHDGWPQPEATCFAGYDDDGHEKYKSLGEVEELERIE